MIKNIANHPQTHLYLLTLCALTDFPWSTEYSRIDYFQRAARLVDYTREPHPAMERERAPPSVEARTPSTEVRVDSTRNRTPSERASRWWNCTTFRTRPHLFRRHPLPPSNNRSWWPRRPHPSWTPVSPVTRLLSRRRWSRRNTFLRWVSILFYSASFPWLNLVWSGDFSKLLPFTNGGR